MTVADERGLILMPGHTFLYSPPVNMIRDLIRPDELGDIYFISMSRVNLGLHQPTSASPGISARTTSRSFATGSTRRRRTLSAMSRSCVFPEMPDVAFINLEFRRGTIAHVELSWLAPSKLRRTTVVGSEKMVVYDDSSTEPVRVFDSGVMLDDPQSFGEFQLSYRTGDIVSPARAAGRAAPARDGGFVPRDPDRREAALVGRARRRGRPDDRGSRRVAGLERQSRPARRRRGDRSLSDRADCVLCFLTHVGHTAQEGPYRGDAGSGPICGARHLYGPSLPT